MCYLSLMLAVRTYVVNTIIQNLKEILYKGEMLLHMGGLNQQYLVCLVFI